MIVLGCYDIKHAEERQKAITTACAAAGLPAPKFACPTFMAATAEAIIQARRGVKVTIAAIISDLALPARHDGYSDVEWRESWLGHLEAHGIAYHPVDGQVVARAHIEQTTRTSVIRSFRRATADLEKAMARALNARSREDNVEERGYVCGRPPYGYCVEEGSFKIDQRQAKAIKLIFSMVRTGKTMASILVQLKGKHADGGLKKRRVQYWDRVKIRRILKHAGIYCLGEYTSTSGRKVTLPDLAFLPKEWVGTSSKGQSDGPVPSARGTGTLASPPPRRVS